MNKIAVILSGCGYLDGAEIREAVLSLLALEDYGLAYQIFAPDVNQYHVVDHSSKQEQNEARNILKEAARIARGEVFPLTMLDVDFFDGLLLPGGFGVAKNFSNIAFEGFKAEINQQVRDILIKFNHQNKKISAICISPALLALAFRGEKNIAVTLGDDTHDNRGLIESLGAIYKPTKPGKVFVDEINKIASCAAYMRNSSLPVIYEEIRMMVEYLSK